MILGMLADGSVHLTAVRRLAPHLTIQNHKEVLDSARGKTKAEVLEIIARLSPRPDVAASVRRLPETAGVLTKPVLAEVSDGAPREVAAVCGTVAAAAGPAESCNPAPFKAEPHTPGPGQPSRGTGSPFVEPLSPGRYKLQLTISGETVEKLRLAQDMLGHANPSGDEAEVLDRALTVLLADLAKKKFADAARPATAEGRKPDPHARGAMQKAPSRHVPAVVKRAVWLRDLGRCAFVGAGGQRCSLRPGWRSLRRRDPVTLPGATTITRAGCISGGAAPAANLFRNKLA